MFPKSQKFFNYLFYLACLLRIFPAHKTKTGLYSVSSRKIKIITSPGFLLQLLVLIFTTIVCSTQEVKQRNSSIDKKLESFITPMILSAQWCCFALRFVILYQMENILEVINNLGIFERKILTPRHYAGKISLYYKYLETLN